MAKRNDFHEDFCIMSSNFVKSIFIYRKDYSVQKKSPGKPGLHNCLIKIIKNLSLQVFYFFRKYTKKSSSSSFLSQWSILRLEAFSMSGAGIKGEITLKISPVLSEFNSVMT